MLLSSRRKSAVLAISLVTFILFVGCLWLDRLMASSFLNIPFTNGVSVSVGAIQLTLILPANSAASDFVKPSIAPFADAIEVSPTSLNWWVSLILFLF